MLLDVNDAGNNQYSKMMKTVFAATINKREVGT